MISAEPQNSLNDYMALGFTKNLEKMPDEIYDGANKNSGIISSLNSDRQLDSVSANKLGTNKLNHIIDLGAVVLNGKDGRIEVKDKGKIIGVIGNL